MNIKNLYQILLLSCFVTIISSCQKLDSIQTSWKYRNDYKIVKQNIPYKIQNIIETDSSKLQANLGNNIQTNIASRFNFKKTHDVIINRKEARKLIKAQLQNLRFDSPQLQPLSVDTPPTSKYYNNVYTRPTSKRVPGQARLGFIFALTSLIPVYGFVAALLAMIFGGIGMYKIETNSKEYRGRGFALTGIFLGAAVVILYAFIIYLLVINSHFI